jgi:hypothetical protein
MFEVLTKRHVRTACRQVIRDGVPARRAGRSTLNFRIRKLGLTDALAQLRQLGRSRLEQRKQNGNP